MSQSRLLSDEENPDDFSPMEFEAISGDLQDAREQQAQDAADAVQENLEDSPFGENEAQVANQLAAELRVVACNERLALLRRRRTGIS